LETELTEVVAYYVDLTEEQGERCPIGTTVYRGHTLPQIHIGCPEWLAISRAQDQSEEKYILYLQTKKGRTLDFLQYDTIDEAFAWAAWVFKVGTQSWRKCNVDYPNSENMPRPIFDTLKNDVFVP
jgi:hypothetical protein